MKQSSMVLMLLAGLSMPLGVAGQTYHEAAHLHGVHFGADMGANGGVTAPPYYSDVEALFGDTGGPVNSTNIAGDAGGWILETVVTDVNDENAPFYQWAWQGGVFGPTNKTLPGYMYYAINRETQGARHSPIVRLQPAYGRNVPFDKPYFGLTGPETSDPYTVADFASDARAAASLMRHIARYYVIGNEVNIADENKRFSGTHAGLNQYQTIWYPTPEQYAQVYMAVRDSMTTATIGSAGTPKALLQPSSPGLAGGVVTMDGNEFLARTIKYINAVNPAKLDGFAIHAYAEPGGSNYGVDGFFDAIREQMCIFGQLGHGNKPVFLTEFNKDMPDAANHLIGVEFVKQAYQAMQAWNTGSNPVFAGMTNQNIVGTNWFVYPSSGPLVTDGWNSYSLAFWKGQTPSPNAGNNVWYAFQHAALQKYPRGATGGGSSWPIASHWWRDQFSGASLDTTPGLPDWHVETVAAGSVSVSGGNAVFQGNGAAFGGAFIHTRGYAFTDFALRAVFTFTNAARSNPTGGNPEANFDIRLREGSSGYALTFFSSSGTDSRAGRIILRQKGPWSQVGSFSVAVPGGINSGDRFEVHAVASGDLLLIKAFKNGSVTPVMNWTVSGNPLNLHAGWIRFGSYGVNRVDLDEVAMGGPAMDPASLAVWASALMLDM